MPVVRSLGGEHVVASRDHRRDAQLPEGTAHDRALVVGTHEHGDVVGTQRAVGARCGVVGDLGHVEEVAKVDGELCEHGLGAAVDDGDTGVLLGSRHVRPVDETN